jgi:hypothetical protein
MQFAHAEVDYLGYDYGFMLTATREGGGRDTVNSPRRVVAIAETRDEVWRRLQMTIRMFDRDPVMPTVDGNRQRA